MPTQTTIYIIGAGAVGKSLAVFLKIAEKQIVLIRGSVDDGSKYTERIKIKTGNYIQEADIEVATLSTLETLEGIVVLTNKSYGNGQLATALRSKTGNSPIVLLQNGLGVEQPFMTNDFPGVYRCVLFLTSQLIDPTTIRFKPVATCPVGIEKGNKETLKFIVENISTSNLKFETAENIQQIIWKKAIVNSAFNSICPLLETDNGVFHRNEAALAIARNVIAECTAIAMEKGIQLQHEEVEESLLQISRASDGQLISTLQDIRNKRKTEIETLNFEIVRIAESLGKAATVNHTKLLGQLTRLKSDLCL